MSTKHTIQNIQNALKPEELQDESILKLLHVLENVRAEEMSCDELYAFLDQFVEREVQSKDAAKIMPLIREHLDLCSHCCDEYEALMSVLEHTKEEEEK
ncbi:MAG: hypothetical protein KA473_08710 [Anaerolineales bacterium]|nr:hypothetical protein [Anaerolineales bacterium]MBP6209509.1 hypothetical protein [Anaerolineales bacterium]